MAMSESPEHNQMHTHKMNPSLKSMLFQNGEYNRKRRAKIVFVRRLCEDQTDSVRRKDGDVERKQKVRQKSKEKPNANKKLNSRFSATI